MAKKKKNSKEQITALICVTAQADLVILKMDMDGQLQPLYAVDCGPSQLLEHAAGIQLINYPDAKFTRIAVIEGQDTVITYYGCRHKAMRGINATEARLVPTARLQELNVAPIVKWLVPMVTHDEFARVDITYEYPVVDLSPSAGQDEFEFEPYTDEDDGPSEAVEIEGGDKEEAEA